MLKFNEQKQIESVNGALALRNQINELIDGICKEGYKNICWLGIGGTYASCLQAEVHMKEKSKLSFFVENAAEYLTTGNKKVGEGTIVIISSVTGTTSEIVDGVKKAQKSGARVIGFIDVATAELAKLVDYVITYPANEQLKFYMVADRFMYNAGEFPEYEDLYKELDQYLATALVEVEKEADAFGEEFANRHPYDDLQILLRKQMLSEKNLQIVIRMTKFIILLGLGTSMVPHILMQCVIGKNSIGFVQNLSTVQNFSMEC